MRTSTTTQHQKAPGQYSPPRLRPRIFQALIIFLAWLPLLFCGVDGNEFSGERSELLPPALAAGLTISDDLVKNIADSLSDAVVSCLHAQGQAFTVHLGRLFPYPGSTFYSPQQFAEDSLHPRPPPSV